MPTFDVSVDDGHALGVRLDAIGPNARAALKVTAGQIARDIDEDARARATAHFHTLGAKPGLYLAAFADGTYDKGDRVGGYVRNANGLAHLLEYGFTISDMTIYAKNGDVMAFGGDVATVFRKMVHRHQTKVEAYPAIGPAFDAASPDIGPALITAVKEAAAG